MLTLLACIIVFGVVITVHEFGHFVVAKCTNMYVREFCIGFGPKLFQRKLGETLYSLRLLPLGGYNDIAGMSSRDNDLNGRGFHSRPMLARMAVILAGSFMNLFMPIILFFMLFCFHGVDSMDNRPIVGRVFDGKPAYVAGLRDNDTILSINDRHMETWADITGAIVDSDAKELKIVYLRNGEQKEVKVMPEFNKDANRYVIGVSSGMVTNSVSVKEALILSYNYTKMMLTTMIEYLYGMLLGQKEVAFSGPVGVARMAGAMAEQGTFMFLRFIAILSLNLGIINLLPLPALDGGHFVLLCIEAITGYKPSKRVIANIQRVGVALILLLLVVATWQDFVRW